MSDNSWTAPWRVAYRRVTSARAVSTPVVAGYVALAVVGGTLVDGAYFGGPASAWLIGETLAAAAFVIICVVVRMTILTPSTPGSRPMVVVGVFLAAGALRFVMLVTVGKAMELDSLWSRLPGTIMTSFGALCLLTLLESQWYEITEMLDDLERENELAWALTLHYEADVERARQAIIGEVEADLRPQLASIRERLRAANPDDVRAYDDATARLTLQAMDELVRPLSHRLYDVAGAEEILVRPVVERDVWSQSPVDVPRAIKPNLILLVLVMGVIGPAVTFGIGSIVSIAVIPLVLAWLILHIVRASWPTSYRLLTPLRALLVSVGVYIAVFAFSRVVVVSVGWFLGGEVVVTRSISFIGFGVIVSTALTLADIYGQRQRHIANELRQTGRSIELITARKRKELWINRRTLSWVLHGPVQSALLSASLSLTRPDLTNDDRVAIDDRICEATALISELPERSGNVPLAMAELSSIWTDTCDINFTMADDVAVLLLHDAQTSLCVSEIVREGVSNAVRHGHASEITVVVGPVTTEFLRVSVSDDGDGLVAHPARGLGSSILDELAIEWSRTSSDSGTALVADVAIG
ncbi:MAG: hypothetical protein WCP26_02955 [Actinomycetes bacterium]